MKLYHGTSSHRAWGLGGITRDGLRAADKYPRRPSGVYLTDSLAVAEDFALDRNLCDVRSHTRCMPVVCEVEVPEPHLLMPDWAMYDSPLTVQFEESPCKRGDYVCLQEFYDAGLKHHGITRGDRGKWREYLDIVHSVIYPRDIPPQNIKCREVS